MHNNTPRNALQYISQRQRVSVLISTTTPHNSDVGSLSNWSVSLAYTGQQTYGLCVRQEAPVDIMALADAYAEDITPQLQGARGPFRRVRWWLRCTPSVHGLWGGDVGCGRIACAMQ